MSTGLDDLVEKAMARKLIDPQPPGAAPEGSKVPPVVEEQPPLQEPTAPPPSDVQPETKSVQALLPNTSSAPEISLAFAINGVKCIVTIHVEQGATVTLPTTPKKAPSGGPKVKGIRGAKTEEDEAPEAFDEAAPMAKDNLPEGYVYDEVVGATIPDESLIQMAHNPAATIPPAWKCPDHGKSEERTSAITGRTFVVCPQCGRLAPK